MPAGRPPLKKSVHLDPKARQAIENMLGPNEAFQCPDCQSKAVIRESKFGPFVGCISYPKCRYGWSPGTRKTRPIIIKENFVSTNYDQLQVKSFKEGEAALQQMIESGELEAEPFIWNLEGAGPIKLSVQDEHGHEIMVDMHDIRREDLLKERALIDQEIADNNQSQLLLELDALLNEEV